MRLTLVSAVLLAVSTMVSAAPHLQQRAVSCTVVSGVCGKSKGNGATGACCTSNDDCEDTCNSSGCGINDGTKPQSFCSGIYTSTRLTTSTYKSTTTTKSSTKTSTYAIYTPTSTPDICLYVSGVCGYRDGNGFTGVCCTSNDDCDDTCNSSGCGVNDGTKPMSACPY